MTRTGAREKKAGAWRALAVFVSALVCAGTAAGDNRPNIASAHPEKVAELVAELAAITGLAPRPDNRTVESKRHKKGQAQ